MRWHFQSLTITLAAVASFSLRWQLVTAMARTHRTSMAGRLMTGTPSMRPTTRTGSFSWVSQRTFFAMTRWKTGLRRTPRLPFAVRREFQNLAPLLIFRTIMAFRHFAMFDRDFCWRTRVQLLPVHCKSSNKFKITRAALESEFKKAQEAGIRVKGVLVANPSNPLGTSMERDTFKTIVSFIKEKKIHLVCDEIFAGTVFAKPCFISISEIIEDDPTCDRDLIHVVSSLSKDLGLPGFRVGIVYSYINDKVVNCCRKMSSFGLVSSQTQHLLSSMLSDEKFITRLLAESARRLSERHKSFIAGLAQMGIRCLESNAGLFCWMDLRPLLKEATVDRELELWKVIVNDVKINVSPGSSFHCAEVGWFRVCFANMNDDTMEVALRRIRSFVYREVAAKAEAKKKRWQAGLRLSLPSWRR